jgi:hypothetical protein
MVSTVILFAILTAYNVYAKGKPLSAYIDSGGIGQAILVERLNSCYAITPAHVLDNAFFATLVGGLPSAPQGEADWLMTFGYDLALLRVNGRIQLDSKEPYHRVADMDNLYVDSTTASIVTVRPDGTQARQPVNIIDTGMLYFHVALPAGEEPLQKGMSGSMVVIKNDPAGLLMSVDSETGYGKVLRYDRMTETIAPFFQKSAMTRTDIEKPALPAASGLSISSWSSPPAGANFRARNLVDGDPGSIWLAKAGVFPVDVEILIGEKNRIFNQIELIWGAISTPEKLPKDFEILVSSKEGGGWISLTSGTLFFKDKRENIQLAPTKVKLILLRIYSNWGSEEVVGLSEVIVR